MQSHNNDVPFTSVAHDISNMAVKNKSSIKSEVKSSEEVEDVSFKLQISVSLYITCSIFIGGTVNMVRSSFSLYT